MRLEVGDRDNGGRIEITYSHTSTGPGRGKAAKNTRKRYFRKFWKPYAESLGILAASAAAFYVMQTVPVDGLVRDLLHIIAALGCLSGMYRLVGSVQDNRQELPIGMPMLLLLTAAASAFFVSFNFFSDDLAQLILQLIGVWALYRAFIPGDYTTDASEDADNDAFAYDDESELPDDPLEAALAKAKLARKAIKRQIRAWQEEQSSAGRQRHAVIERNIALLRAKLDEVEQKIADLKAMAAEAQGAAEIATVTGEVDTLIREIDLEHLPDHEARRMVNQIITPTPRT
ncbi:MAG: hypothetical protein BWY68_00024 [bacterium ADurb.Bin400]|nr:MAG: hypothetical protein BWY68_00024 [bacterium ADurb.Bin400]